MQLQFTADQLRDLPDIISAPRFATYLQAMGNNKEAALSLYQWNLQISAAFIVPLQVCEVAARNGVVEVLEKVHGPNWPWSNGFLRSLPVPRDAKHYSARNDLQRLAALQPTAGKVVAELKFAFWEKMFTAGQDDRLWNRHLHSAFPGINLAFSIPAARANAFDALEKIRKLRNRIAHHEPIFTRDLAVEYARIHDVIHWRRPVAAAWVDSLQAVTALLALKP